MSHVPALKRAYKQWSSTKGKSVQRWMDMMADDIKWYSLAAGAKGMEFTQTCSCKKDVERYFEGLAAEWVMLHYTPELFVEQGNQVVVKSRCGYRSTRTGKKVQTAKADFFTFRRGKVVEFHEFYDTKTVLEATQPDAGASGRGATAARSRRSTPARPRR